ncbi:SPOR domain-containing protein [Vibrio variabilis]|uniref:SPOR domain-containing protein n=1 Tax=Vibrio variabilis TaxID=990271 RepID=UPI000DD72410|nr:SPOR domain-containing protein [Vibrio variabilis]
MKKVVIVSLATMLAACSSGDFTAEVKSESYREDYQPVATTAAPVAVATTAAANADSEKVAKSQKAENQPAKAQAASTQTASTATKQKAAPVKAKPAQDNKVVKIVPPSKKQAEQNVRFGYTIQVVAVGSQDKVTGFANKLPKSSQPVWQNYKVVNGTKWYALLYGDFATKVKAQQAIKTLPQEFQDLKPFVRSIDKIKKSDYPTLSKLN